MELQVALKDNYFETDNFQRQLNKTVNEINSVDGEGSSTDLEALNNLLWSMYLLPIKVTLFLSSSRVKFLGGIDSPSSSHDMMSALPLTITSSS